MPCEPHPHHSNLQAADFLVCFYPIRSYLCKKIMKTIPSIFCDCLRNNEKLPSLSLPLNLNLNYENLLFSLQRYYKKCKYANFFRKKYAFLSKNILFFFKISPLHQFPLQCCSTCFLYLYHHQLAYFPSFSWENHGLILRSPAVHILFAAFRIAFY